MGDAGGGNASEGKNVSFLVQIVENPDGSVTRPAVPLSPPAGEHQDSPVHSKEIPLNPANNTSLRIYRPNLPSSTEKLPIVLYFHGGGFVLFNAASIFYHMFCEQMAKALPALVISLDYRLAPEHRLPAAYDDAVEAVLWVRDQARDPAAGDPWLASHGDFSRCFLMGSSSGANMAYHTGLRAAELELEPFRLAGLVFNQPYFGGVERTPSEQASGEDVILPLRANDMLWRLALPKGADRDHEFANPMDLPPPPNLPRLPRCLVMGCEGDPLIDRQREFAKMLEGTMLSVVARLDDKGFHAMELLDPAKAQALFDEVRDFVYAA